MAAPAGATGESAPAGGTDNEVLTMSVGVHSEVGTLRQVMAHRPSTLA